jgi:flagellar L-ring protein precursor FlgH
VAETQAESLFRGSAQYSAPAPGAPRSLFTAPLPRAVGDIVTISIDDLLTIQNTADVRLNKTQTLQENGTGLLNNAVRSFVGRLPFINGAASNRVSNWLQVPSFNGLDNQNVLSSRAQNNQIRRVIDNITCQVVQILPNGFLVVEGRKLNLAKKEETVLYVTGIVNPYFLDRRNAIPSRQVANLEYRLAGRGLMSRQQGDNIASKLYQFFQ